MHNIIIVNRWRVLFSSAAHVGLIAGMAVWLAVFAPMLCQYHGLMWNHMHMDGMTATDPSWDNPMPAMDMVGMEMTAEEHQRHLHSMSMNHTVVESPQQHIQYAVIHQAILPVKNVTTTNSASMYNPVPTLATMLVSILLIHVPSQLSAVARDNQPTRVHPKSSSFPLQLAIPPLEQPPRL